VTRHGRLGRGVAATAVGLLLTVGVAACGSNQDPGIVDQPGTRGPTTTGHFLQPCPPGGPDATTPAAGCTDKDGRVVH
jgi:hypothetical protein